jgi:TPR repeat protein
VEIVARVLAALLLGYLAFVCATGALAEAESAPEPTDAEGQFELGRRLVWGLDGTEKDERAGFEWLLKAAEQGHPRAQTQVAMAYQKARGVRQDFPESAKWMRKAADQGHPKAQFELGVYYRDGRGVPADQVLALMWLLLSQEKGGIAARVVAPGQLRRLKPRDRKEAWELVYQWREAHGLPRLPPRVAKARAEAEAREKAQSQPAAGPEAAAEVEPKQREGATPAEAPPPQADAPPPS